GDLLHLVRAVAGGEEGADQATHARPRHQVGAHAQVAEDTPYPDVAQAAGAAAAEGQPQGVGLQRGRHDRAQGVTSSASSTRLARSSSPCTWYAVSSAVCRPAARRVSSCVESRMVVTAAGDSATSGV